MHTEWSDSADQARTEKWGLPQCEPRSITKPVPKGTKGDHGSYHDYGDYIAMKPTKTAQKIDAGLEAFGAWFAGLFRRRTAQ